MKCACCPFLDICEHKKMEMVGFLEPASSSSESELQNSMIVPHNYRQVKIAPHTKVTIDLEDIKKEIERSIAKNAGLYGGFLSACN